MRMLKYAIIATILTAFVATAAAAPAELRIFPETSSTEINSFTSYEVEVINRGENSDRYRMSSPNSEVTVAPTHVPEQSDRVLEPGESRIVNVWYNPGPEKEAGRHSFQVRATSQASGERYSVTGQVDVIKDHQVDVQVSDPGAVCRGETANYQVSVTNDGIQDEEFQLTTRFGELSESRVNLAPGETREVTLTASSDEVTEQNFNVIAASTTSYAQDIENVQFVAENCYDSEIVVQPEDLDAAAYAESELEVTVRNTGTRTDTFTLSSNMGSFDQSTFEIPGGETASTVLRFTPTELGEQTISITADSQVSTTRELTVNVENRMESQLDFQTERTQVCEQEQFTLRADLVNTGDAEEQFDLSTTEGELEEDSVTLSPQEFTEVLVNIDASEYDEGNHTVDLSATASTFGEPVSEDSAEFEVMNCYDLDMVVEPSVASAGENRSTVYEIRLTNPGHLDNTYSVSAEGPEWISVRPEQVSVAPGETGYSYIYAGVPFGKEEGEVRITATAEGTHVSRNQTVRLILGDEIEEAINSTDQDAPIFDDRFNLPAVGDFTGNVSDGIAGDLARAAASIMIGLLIVAAVLYHEW